MALADLQDGRAEKSRFVISSGSTKRKGHVCSWWAPIGSRWAPIGSRWATHCDPRVITTSFLPTPTLLMDPQSIVNDPLYRCWRTHFLQLTFLNDKNFKFNPSINLKINIGIPFKFFQLFYLMRIGPIIFCKYPLYIMY